jgi:hypothetical protein
LFLVTPLAKGKVDKETASLNQTQDKVGDAIWQVTVKRVEVLWAQKYIAHVRQNLANCWRNPAHRRRRTGEQFEILTKVNT